MAGHRIDFENEPVHAGSRPETGFDSTGHMACSRTAQLAPEILRYAVDIDRITVVCELSAQLRCQKSILLYQYCSNILKSS